MEVKPFSYESQKTILMKMDPNKRIELVQSCPALLTAHRNTPLHFNLILFNEDVTVLNNTAYHVSKPTRRDIDAVASHNGLSMMLEGQKIDNIIHKPYSLEIPEKEAMGRMNSELLEGENVYVKHLKIDCVTSERVFLSRPLKLHVGMVEFVTFDNFDVDSLTMLIDPSSFPLNLNLDSERIGKNFHHSIVKSAKQITVDVPFFFASEFVNFLTSCPCLKVHTHGHRYPNYISNVVDNWLKAGKAHGTSYSFDIGREKASECLTTIATKPEVVKKSERSTTLRMSKDALLIVSIDAKVDENPRFPIDENSWLLKMEVINQ